MRLTFKVSRRAFLGRMLALAGAGALAPVLAACRARPEAGPPATGATPTPPRLSPTPAAPSAASPAPVSSPGPSPTPAPTLARVALVRTSDRAEGVRRALALLGMPPVEGKAVVLKPNFNSADPAPGSTHNDVLRALVEALWEGGARSITVADRSGMGDTRRVMEQKGILALAAELGFETLVLDELGPEDWVSIQPPDSHWSRGFLFARPILEADAVVQTGCLKTHRYGGHFTLSLKNSVGMVAKYGPDGYNYMGELHRSPHQRKMIAEINVAYRPALVVLDGVEAFVTGGPDRGKRVQAEVVLAGSDRVALDAVGVAILRLFGTTPEVERGPVFAQEQIALAVALGLGVSRPEDIQFLTDDGPSADYAARVQEMLQGGDGHLQSDRHLPAPGREV